MQREALKQIVGIDPLPADIMKRIKLLIFADAHHVLGQMAAAHEGRYNGKIVDVFENALLRTAHDHGMLKFEMNRIERALEGTAIHPILLKGGAYVAVQHKAAAGRRVSDIDILVAEDQLDIVEKALNHAGWRPDEETDNSYDQGYYRQWMHELPPLRHYKRGTIIDVHHSILPRTARIKLDLTPMFESAVHVQGRQLQTFNPVDVFIHSAVHAFGDGAFDNPVRSLVEHYFLFNALTITEQETLIERAYEIGANRPVALAVWCTATLFGVKNAADLIPRMKKSQANGLLRWAIVSKALGGWATPIAKGLLYIRSHYLRMPMRLLVPHLARKAIQWRPRSNKPVELPTP